MGGNHRPKHLELIGIINKSLLLHLVGCILFISMMHGQANIKVSLASLEPNTHFISYLILAIIPQVF
jgi:hypothetical protein